MQEEAPSAHRSSARLVSRIRPALAIAAALLVPGPTASAFSLHSSSLAAAGVGAQRAPLQLSAAPRRAALYSAPTCTLSVDPVQTLVRSAGNSVVTQFRDLKLRTTGFLRGGKVPAHEKALKSSKELAHWLHTEAGCDMSLWGVGKAKEPKHLLQELRKGESFLRADGRRVLKVAKVRIYDGDFELVEVSQILGAKLEGGTVSGGIVKARHGRHLAEKFKPGETPLQACGRGIAEELEQLVGTNPAIHVLNKNGKVAAWEEEEESTSYPGLSSLYQLYFVECEVEGLNRAATGMTFYTGEDCSLDGHCDKVHVWEWIKRTTAETTVPEGCRPIEATLWSMD
jgi:hypothetical protein